MIQIRSDKYKYNFNEADVYKDLVKIKGLEKKTNLKISFLFRNKLIIHICISFLT